MVELDKLRDNQTIYYQEYYRQRANEKASLYLSGSPLMKWSNFAVFRITAILCADDDGGRALGEIKNGVVKPKPDYLTSSDGNRNYIQDWIDLANDQLLTSGASFMLDNPEYVLIKNTSLNSIDCSAEGITFPMLIGDRLVPGPYLSSADLTVSNFLRTQPEYQEYFDNSIVLIFRWGKHPTLPDGQGCSWYDKEYIQMPPYYFSHYCDGKEVFGNALFTHELGHYMCLAHPFPPVAVDIERIARTKNDTLLPFLPRFLSQMDGMTIREMMNTKNEALRLFETYKWALDQDGTDPNDRHFVDDTPLDLGPGLPLIMGNMACAHDLTYQLKKYHSNDLEFVYDEDGNYIGSRPKEGINESDQYLQQITVNDAVRRNIMGYWGCNPEIKYFSSSQVEVMNSFLSDPIRSSKYYYIKKGSIIYDPKKWEIAKLCASARKFHYGPIGGKELMNIEKELKTKNPIAYDYQFRPKPFHTCAAEPKLQIRSS